MSRRSIRALESWGRPREGRIVAGVCLAIAERTGVHPLLVRLAFVVLGLAQGVGVALYAALWLALPEEGERLTGTSLGRALHGRLRSAAGEVRASFDSARAALGRGRTGSSWPRPFDRWWLGLTIAAAGALIVAASFGLFGWITPTRALGLAAIAGGIGLLLHSARDPRSGRR